MSKSNSVKICAWCDKPTWAKFGVCPKCIKENSKKMYGKGNHNFGPLSMASEAHKTAKKRAKQEARKKNRMARQR